MKIIGGKSSHKKLKDLNSKQYHHLTKEQFELLTQGKNADRLHKHRFPISGGGGGGGEGTDFKVSVSATDTAPSTLDNKLVEGSLIQLTKVNEGGNESYKIDYIGGSGSGNEIWLEPVISRSISDPPNDALIGDRYVIARGGVWYNDEWPTRQKITIDNTKVGEDETNHLVTIIIDAGNDVFTDALANGDDILFTLNDKVTKLSHEIERWVPGSEIGVFRVKIPSTSSTVDTEIYMYYGNASASNQEGGTETYREEYGAFYEMNITGTDSTINARDTVSVIGDPTENNDANGLAVAFDGNDAWSATNISYYEQEWATRTVNVIFTTDSSDITTRQVFGPAEGGSVNGLLSCYVRNSKIYARWWSESKGWSGDHQVTTTTAPGVAADGTISTNTKYHVTASYNFGTGGATDKYELWVNGVQQDGISNDSTVVINAHSGNGSVCANTGTNSKDFDNGSGTGQYCKGTIHQIEMLDEQWNTNKHVTWYNMHSNNATFLSFGAEEIPSGPTGLWTDEADNIATRIDTPAIWDIVDVIEGMVTWAQDEEEHITYDGSLWTIFKGTTSHNSLSNIHGGTAGPPPEYYHMTLAEHTAATRNATNSLNGLMPPGKLDNWDDGYKYRLEGIDADTGSATPVNARFTIEGTGGIVTSGTGDTISIDGSGITGVAGYTATFVIGDWFLDSGEYSLTITHSLGELTPIIQIQEGTNHIYVNKIERIDANNIKLWVPSDPDLRFDGNISIIKT